MTTFVTNETEDEEIIFATFGKLKPGQNAKKSLLVKEGENLTGTVLSITPSQKFGQIYRLKVKGQDLPVVITGKSDLNDKMGYGTKKAAKKVKVDSLVQITFDGIKQTAKGNNYYQFTVGIAK